MDRTHCFVRAALGLAIATAAVIFAAPGALSAQAASEVVGACNCTYQDYKDCVSGNPACGTVMYCVGDSSLGRCEKPGGSTCEIAAEGCGAVTATENCN